MIVVHKIMHYTEFLEKSRDSNFSKLEVKVHSNKTLRNPEVVNCKMYINLYDAQAHGNIETTIGGCLLEVSRNEDLPQDVKEIAGGFLAYFNTGVMTWMNIKVWHRLMAFETINELSLGIPKKIKDFVKEYYTTEVERVEL